MPSTQILISKQMSIKNKEPGIPGEMVINEALKVQGEPAISSVRRQLSAQRWERECQRTDIRAT